MKNYEIVKEALWGRSHKYNFQQMTNVAESTKNAFIKSRKKRTTSQEYLIQNNALMSFRDSVVNLIGTFNGSFSNAGGQKLTPFGASVKRAQSFKEI